MRSYLYAQTVVSQRRQTRVCVSRCCGEQNVDALEPLNFVTVKCQFCGTFYRLTPGKMEEGRTCPKCHETQRGSLSIVGAPLS